MEKYILELISENNRVIIPNFGAFIVSKEHGASILFNNFLSFNDGLLVNYIAEQKSIDTIIATDEVFDYVDKLKKELDETGSYNIEKLGTFRKDDNGILRFQQAEDFADQFKSGSLEQKEEGKEDGSEEKTETKEETKTVFELDSDEDRTDKVEEEKPAEKKEEEIEKPKAEVDSSKETTQTDNKVVVTPPLLEKERRVERKQPVTEKKSEPRKQTVQKRDDKKGLIIFVIIAAIIVLGLAAYLLFFNKKKQPENKVAKKEVVKPPVKKPVLKDTIMVKPKEEKPKVEEKTKVVKPILTKGQIHIIVGGFKDVNNARKMVDKLKGDGYLNAQIILLNNMHLVSADSGSSYTQMEEVQQEILSKQIESWLYKVK